VCVLVRVSISACICRPFVCHALTINNTFFRVLATPTQTWLTRSCKHRYRHTHTHTDAQKHAHSDKVVTYKCAAISIKLLSSLTFLRASFDHSQRQRQSHLAQTQYTLLPNTLHFSGISGNFYSGVEQKIFIIVRSLYYP